MASYFSPSCDAAVCLWAFFYDNAQEEKKKTAVWLDLHVLNPFWMCYTLCSLFSILDHREATGRTQHSARCSNKVKIWIMLITPRISIPFSNCPMSPTD